MTEGIEDGHVELVVLLGTEATCPQLRDECGAAHILVSITLWSNIKSDEYRSSPALERIHELARRLEAPPHEQRLLAHHGEGIFE